MTRLRWLGRVGLALCAALAAALAAAAQPDALAAPASAASAAPRTLIRLWGHGSRQADPAGALVRAWARGFERQHPGVRVEATLRGDSTAIGGLYTGAADLALMERAPLAIELEAYRPIFGNDPLRITVATGSLDHDFHAPAPVIFVNRSNPLQRLSLQQLAAILGLVPPRGQRAIRTWGGLGLKGAWAARPITVYMPRIVDEVPQFLQAAVLGGSPKWTPQLREFADAPGSLDGERGTQIVRALEQDPAGIAIARWSDRTPRVHALALAADPAGPWALPTDATLQQGRYPLARSLSLYLVQPQGGSPDPNVVAFVRYVLGPEGQRDVAQDGGYLPLTAERIHEQLGKLP